MSFLHLDPWNFLFFSREALGRIQSRGGKVVPKSGEDSRRRRGLGWGKGKGGEPHLLVAKRRWEVVVEGSPVVQVCGGGCSLAWWRSGEGKRRHLGRRALRGRGGSVPWVGLLRGWPEMGSPRRWGAGGACGSLAMVLGELGLGRSAKARPRSSSGGLKNWFGGQFEQWMARVVAPRRDPARRRQW